VKDPVLILNQMPFRWMYHEDRCLLPIDRVDPVLITRFHNVGEHDPSLFQHTMVCDFADEAQVLAVARWAIETHGIRRIIGLEERVVLTAAALRTEYGLPGLGHAEALVFRDKVAMKRAVAAAGVRVPAYVAVDSIEDLRRVDWSRGRAVVKGRFGAGSEDVFFVDSLAAAEVIWRQRRPGPGEYEVEEFIDGTMYHCDAVLDGGQVLFAQVCEYLLRPGDFAPGATGGSLTIHSGPVRTAILALNELVLRTLGMQSGATHLEVFHNTAGELVFCEVACRPGGAGLDRIYECGFGVNTLAAALHLESGQGYRVPHCADDPTRPVVGIVAFFPDPAAGPAGIAPERFAELGIVEHKSNKWAGVVDGNPRHGGDYRDRYIVVAESDAAYRERFARIEKEYWR